MNINNETKMNTIQVDKILSSERDKQVFYDALLKPRKANEALKSAAVDYEKFMRRGK